MAGGGVGGGDIETKVIDIIIEAQNNATEGIAGASGSLQGFSASLMGIGKSMALIGGGMTIAGAAIAAGIGLLVDQAANFDTTLIKVQNNTTMTDANVAAMRDTILTLGQQTGASFDSLATGFMKVMNITGDAAASTDILTVATESAVSTGGDAAATANILANAMHEYGVDVSHAATEQERHNAILANASKMMGTFHLAAAEGNMTLEQFSTESGKAIGVAANLGIPVEQVAAAFAALTKHGYDAAQAQTQLVALLTHMIKPAAAAEAELKKLSKATGIDLVGDFSAAGVASKGLDGVLEDLRLVYQKMGYTQAEATGESMKLVAAQRGGLGLASLLGTAWNDNVSILADLTDAQKVDSITAESMARTHETLSNQMAVLKNVIEAAAISLGEAFMPAIQAHIGKVKEVVGVVVGWIEKNKDLVAHVALLAAGFLLVAGPILMFLGVLAMAVAGFGALVAMINPVTVGIILLIAIGAALYAAWQSNFHGIRETVTTTFAQIQATVTQVIAFLAPYVTAGLAALVVAFQDLVAWAQVAGPKVQAALVVAFQDLVAWAEVAGPKVQAALVAVVAAFHTAVEWVQANWPTVQTTITNVFTTILAVIQAVVSFLAPFVTEQFSYITQWVSVNFPAMREIAEAVWKDIQSVVTTVVNQVVALVREYWPVLFTIITNVLHAISDVVTFVWNTVAAFWKANHTTILAFLQMVWNIFQIVVSTAIHNILGLITVGLDLLTGNWTGAWYSINAILQETWDAMTSIVDLALAFINTYLLQPALAAIASAWSSAWTSIGNVFASAWMGIVGTAKSGVNQVISLINDLIGAWDAITLSIPGFSVGIPSVTVPGVGTIGGGSLSWGGFSESVNQIAPIPMLGMGGIVTAPTLILAGESGPEAIVPLGRGVGGGGGPTFHLHVTGNTIMRRDDADEIVDWFATAIEAKYRLSTQH
jgi:TP901 family phage tail tape measure protein